MTESCVLISINSKNSIPGPKFCLKSFNQIISNGAQQNDPQQHSKTQSGGKLNGIKYFHFLPTETIAQKTLLILCVHLICILLVNLTVPHLHSSRKIQTPIQITLFLYTQALYMYLRITFIPVLHRLPFISVPRTYCRYMYMDLRNEAPNIFFILK